MINNLRFTHVCKIPKKNNLKKFVEFKIEVLQQIIGILKNCKKIGFLT